jgi:hypothetical protein
MAVKNESQFIVLMNWDTQVDFTEFSGGESSRPVERYPLGLEDKTGFTVGIEEISDISLKAPYDPEIHDPLYDKYKTYCGEPIDITVTPVRICPERTPDGKTETFTGCVPVKCKRPSVNRGGKATGMFELSFAVSESKLG